MKSVKIINSQVEEFHQEMVELIKKYQFRDRNQMTAHGISVSQCYILETLFRHGPLSMKKMAEKMHLKISTVTRIVEQLLKKRYVTKQEGQKDKRVRNICITKEGYDIFQLSWKEVFESEKMILENFPESNRTMLIQFLKSLNHAVDKWHSCCGRS